MFPSFAHSTSFWFSLTSTLSPDCTPYIQECDKVVLWVCVVRTAKILCTNDPDRRFDLRREAKHTRPSAAGGRTSACCTALARLELKVLFSRRTLRRYPTPRWRSRQAQLRRIGPFFSTSEDAPVRLVA